MTVAYTASDRNNVTCQTLAPFRWYRYTGTDEGYLTNACPEDFQCGSYSQIWLNDSLPDVNEGETLKSVCIRKKNSCCAAKTTIRAKNCTDFVIYFIIPVPDCANYCYEAPKEDPALSSNKDPICDGDVESFPALVWIIIISLGLLLLLMGLLVFVRGRLKRKNRLQTEEGNEIKNLPPLYDRDPQIKRTRFNRNMLNNTRI
ncbi:oncoprotein-induced transcript 3 protein-like [Mercenaria mercenaria]|uniref:oncoprotein-induced transcript 3 protein-like n=1 Tax=Mercenaria mercenaria TaxID=6596 RepID=UPI00234F449E|nr:oncoprotein-induced transcript 3 protein-like [Mercenaria mercenaria]